MISLFARKLLPPLVLLAGVLCLAYHLLANINPIYYFQNKSGNNYVNATSQPNYVKLRKQASGFSGTYLYKLDYQAGQNTDFVVEKFMRHGCIEKIKIISAGSQISEEVYQRSATSNCARVIIKGIDKFKPGTNYIEINLSAKSESLNLTVNPLLIGSNLSNFLIIAAIYLSIFYFLNIALKQCSITPLSRHFLLSALFCYSFWLHIYPSSGYTNDLNGHIAYAKFMAENWSQAYQYRGPEFFHPPFYYFIAGKLIDFMSADAFINPFLFWRLLSLTCFLTFCFFGLKTIELFFVHKKAILLTTSLIFLFWPLNIIMASRISNDIPQYAAWAAIFYYLFRWLKNEQLKDLAIAIVALGIAFIIKTNAAIPAAIILSLVFIHLIKNKNLQSFLKNPSIVHAVLFLLLGLLLNQGRLIHDYILNQTDLAAHLGAGSNDPVSWQHFLGINLKNLFDKPYAHLDPYSHFLNYFLKTTLFGEFDWGFKWIAGIMNIVLILLAGLTLLGIYPKLRTKDKTCWTCLYMLGIGISALITLMLMKRWIVTQDFRFIFPLLIPSALLIGNALENFQSNRKCFFAVYAVLFACLNLLGSYLYLNQL